MKKNWIYIMVIAMLFLSSCQGDTAQTPGKLSVTASFYAMYDFARLIGGDKAEVYNLTEGGGEPHEFEPSAADIVRIENSDIFIYSSENMESWSSKIASSIKNDVIIVRAADGTAESSEGDPHVWLDPKNAYIQMENICSAFCRADSANADYYRANLAVCREKTDALDKRFSESLPKGRKIIVSHEAYGYLCSAYEIEQTALSGMTDEGEASPAKIARVIEFAKENGIKYVYAESGESSKVMQTVADGAGAEVLFLSPFESEPAGRGYFEVMEDNLAALIKAEKS